ncbi:hypothetical protein QBC43DRAFT_7880 [Cladorrhinum sp. PSN259]|nr:hypothetical protein QBC43DRAFT_7880 [Cladorrhinum sp. PSN259]
MATMYSNMPSQDELASLFARQFTLDQPAPAPVQAPEPVQAPKIVYISQHYNHSAHLARQNAQQAQQAQQAQRPASEPPQSENATVERILREHSVDPSGLSQAQLQLFKTVDDPQKLRLIDLWRACPPTNSNNNPTLGWGITTVDQEESLAKARYEQKQHEEQMQLQQQQLLQQQEEIMSLDGTPLTPVQAGDGRWIETYSGYMEPYMMDGYADYEARSRRDPQPLATAAPSVDTTFSVGRLSRASDPVYMTMNVGVAAEWNQRQQDAMADQYGMLMAMRGSEDQEML